MAVSQNGWKANDRSLIASYDIGGGKVAVRKGDVATVLVYVARRFDSEVEKLVWPGNWGYAERPIRGSRTTSNHASGTAIDLNAPRHPLGKQGTFSKSQVRKIKKILSDCGGVVRWGGNYSGRKDEMHFEINAGSARVREVAKAIRAGKKPGPSGGATASPSGGGSSYGDANAKHDVGSRVMRKYTSGTDVRWLQKRLYKLGYDLEFDGDFGPKVEDAVKAFQKKAGIAVDGEVYTDTIKALKAAKVVRELPKSSTPKAPKFPLPAGHYFGPKTGPDSSVSGYYSHREHLRTWQKRMQKRGWTIKADGLYGPGTAKVAGQFQTEKGLAADKLIGIDTWDAAWEEPVT